MGQYKVELKGSNFFIRAYTNQERSGDSHAIGIQSALINEAWKKSFDNTNLQTTAASWFPQYGLNYAGGAMQVFSTAYKNALTTGQNLQQAYQTAIEAKILLMFRFINLRGRLRIMVVQFTGQKVLSN